MELKRACSRNGC